MNITSDVGKFSRAYICIIGVFKVREKEEIFEEIQAEKFPSFIETINL